MKLKDLITKLLKDAASWPEIETAINEHVEEEKGDIVTKNDDLVKDIRRLKKQIKDGNSEDANALQEKLDQALSQSEQLQTKLKEANKKAEKAEGIARTETEAHHTTLIDSALTNELVKAKVAPQFLDAAKALHRSGATVKVDSDGKRSVLIGDKALAAHVSEWSLSDGGKPFVAAALNNGGNAPGGGNNLPNGAKSVTRAAFEGMDMLARAAHIKGNGVVTDA